MALQICDRIKYAGDIFEIGAVEKGKHSPLDARTLGFMPECTEVNCFRGFAADFAIIRDSLTLTDITVNDANRLFKFFDGAKGPLVLRQSCKGDKIISECRYEKLKLPVPYSGSFAASKYRSEKPCAYFEPFYPFLFDVAVEMEFKNGVLYNVRDLSEAASFYRENNVYGDREKRAELCRLVPGWIAHELRVQ